jgi:hypothetical protein
MAQFCFYTFVVDSTFDTKQYRSRTQTFAPDKCKYSVGAFMSLSGICIAAKI